MKNETQAKISIDNFIKILKIHKRTLNIWDKKEILIPKKIENEKYYLKEDLEKAKFILFLNKNLLINLNAIKIIIDILNRSKINAKDYLKYTNEILGEINAHA